MNCHDFHSGIGLPEEFEGHHWECDACQDWLRQHSNGAINCEISQLMITVGTISRRLRMHLKRCEACRRLDVFADLKSVMESVREAIKALKAENTSTSETEQIEFAQSALEAAKKTLKNENSPS